MACVIACSGGRATAQAFGKCAVGRAGSRTNGGSGEWWIASDQAGAPHATCYCLRAMRRGVQPAAARPSGGMRPLPETEARRQGLPMPCLPPRESVTALREGDSEPNILTETAATSQSAPRSAGRACTGQIPHSAPWREAAAGRGQSRGHGSTVGKDRCVRSSARRSARPVSFSRGLRSRRSGPMPPGRPKSSSSILSRAPTTSVCPRPWFPLRLGSVAERACR
jgi:hypothetical protein